MKLTYWLAKDLTEYEEDEDGNVEEPTHVRAKSRKDCKAEIEGMEDSYSVPTKIEVEYANGFDLLDQCLAGLDLAYFEAEED